METCFTWAATLLLLLITVLYLLGFNGYIRRSYYMYKLPGKKGWPIIGNLFDFMVPVEDLLMTATSMCLPNEKLIGAIGLHNHYVMLYKPETVEVILSNPKYSYKGGEYHLLKRWLGEGLVTSEGAKWAERRRLLTPSFHFKILEEFVDVMNERSIDLARNLVGEFSGKFIDVTPKMSMCTLDVICETAMGKSINSLQNVSEYTKAITEITALIAYRFTRPWFINDRLFRLTEKGKIHDAHVKTLHDFTESVLRERRKCFNSNGSETEIDETGIKRRRPFLDLLLDVSANGKVLSDSDIRDEVDTFMFAGHDTTATATSWCLYALATNPKYQKQVQEELDGIFEDSDRPVTMTDLPLMKFMDMCIKESLRLYPPIPYISRELQQDAVLDGYLVPSGTIVDIMIFQLHRNAQVFPNPDVFNPDNFSPERTKGRHPYAFLPFSAGPRNCIGQKFAGIEEKILLANILRRTNVEALHKPDEIHLTGLIVLGSREGVMLTFTPRK